MGMMSRRKGARAEVELSHWMTERGYPARRGRQFCGSPDSPDVYVPTLPVYPESKRSERFSLYPALEQAATDADERPPAVFHRKNRKRWVIVMYADDFLALVGDAA